MTCVVVGMERGNVMVRAWPSFENLYSLDFRYTFGHSSGPVRVVEAGEVRQFLDRGVKRRFFFVEVTNTMND